MAKDSACGNLSCSVFSLSVVDRSSSMPRASCAVRLILKRNVVFVIVGATTPLFRIWRVWFAIMAISSKKIFFWCHLGNSFCAKQIVLFNSLDSGCMTSKSSSFARRATQTWLCCRLSIVAEVQVKKNDYLLPVTWPCSILIFIPWDLRSVYEPFQRIVTVVPSSSLTLLWPWRIARTNVSPKSAPKNIGAAKESHRLKITSTL